MLALVVLLAVATPAFGDDVTKKHQVDNKISNLRGRLAAQKQHEQSLRNAVQDFTSRIRTLEGRVGTSPCNSERSRRTSHCTSGASML